MDTHALPSIEAVDPPTVQDIEAAAGRIDGQAVVTPLLENALINRRLGGRLLIKAEVLQKTGSFKFRGALNNVAQIPEERRANGVLAYSSGNHAQGVAAAAFLAGIPATILMPKDAPAIKRRNTEAWGAEVVLYDRWTESREEIGARLAADSGATLIKPYDHPYTIAGQGTVGLEIAAQCAALGAAPDAVVSCCGGGGLVSGIALALETRLPGVPVYAAEPADFDDTARSLAEGERVRNDPGAQSICDAILTPTPGELTWPVNQRLLAGSLTVTDDEVLAAMALAFDAYKIVVEPGGAVALAAALSGKVSMAEKTVVVVASGGNVDPAMFQRALATVTAATTV